MNGTTARARDGRSAANTRRAARPPAQPPRRGGMFTDGANALRFAHADPVAEHAPPVAEPAPRRGRRRDTTPGTEPLSAAPPLAVTVPRAPFLVFVLAVVVVGVLGVLVLNTKINENAFRLDEMRNRQETLDQKEQQLARDLAERETPGNLAAAAKRLGLVPAGALAYINLPDGRIVGVPQPASQRPSSVASAPNEAGR